VVGLAGINTLFSTLRWETTGRLVYLLTVPVKKPSDIMPTYATDPLNVEMLRCQRCGKELFRIEAEDTPAIWPLTARQDPGGGMAPGGWLLSVLSLPPREPFR
jgi:hypothetical protein